MSKKTKTMYLVYNSKGIPSMDTLAYYGSIAKLKWHDGFTGEKGTWKYWYKYGCRCKKVKITIEIITK